MDQKTFTRGDKQGESSKEVLTKEYNFGGPYPQYKVCDELGIDPTVFGSQIGIEKLRD
jgi:hypothetical protein